MQLLSFHLCISIAIRLTRISRGRNFHCKLLFRLNQQGVSEIAQNLQSWAQRDSQGQVFYLHNPGALSQVMWLYLQPWFQWHWGRRGGEQSNCGINVRGYTVCREFKNSDGSRSQTAFYYPQILAIPNNVNDEISLPGALCSHHILW